ncbi:hypothetical protein CC86DRAFT_329982 [Ophiobolus disseminans]|uniref:Jacalin-type lectin domain-containing protein n=1 Tax=Ophiobolus disseminans TaxID=1469910 RepID=A0A6A6ZMX7_9PLEO|nr:hypothetical protein CC86DRAFT_329982 [Ophiobolus disseminans]
MTQSKTPLHLTNLVYGETVHQRCLLLNGECMSTSTDEAFISIKTKGINGSEHFPEQTWPAFGGHFKALVILSPGLNQLEITHEIDPSASFSITIAVNYIPLLQNPPLHLVIMVAKDSPCIIDCPPHKAGGLSSAHADLDAAIAKLRMTAYMWQAMTGEDLRLKGLGRRSFRLDEEWTADTVSREFLNARMDGQLDSNGAMRSTARINVIHSSKSVQEIRDANVAQQNTSAESQDALFDYFQEALEDAGGPFVSHARPIVAGLILDSHYDAPQRMILGHAALGCHNAEGVSLGMFGSHLTYSWPRFLEEVTACLTDIRHPGTTVGNDNGECGTLWEACTIGQGAHLHEVGHAFGLPHRLGIMERGYAQDWPKHFLSKTAYCSQLKTVGKTVDMNTPNNARWNLADALAFRVFPHFRLPSDTPLSNQNRKLRPRIEVEFADTDEGCDPVLRLSAPVGIARVTFNEEKMEAEPTAVHPMLALHYTESSLQKRFDMSAPLPLNILGFNGQETTITNVWSLFSNKSFFRIPDSTIRLNKRSVQSYTLDARPDEDTYDWVQLLQEKGSDGILHRATSIDLRVGIHLDGGVVKYADGHKSHWGPMRHEGRTHRFGGHASEKIELPEGVEISRLEIKKEGQRYNLEGVRMHLANGTVRGELNAEPESPDVQVLEPGPNESVVGFYGKSQRNGWTGVMELGIITVSKDVGLSGLPEAVYDMPELKNTAGLGDNAYSNESDGDDSQDDDDGTMDCDDE